jgi:DNA polymerase-4
VGPKTEEVLSRLGLKTIGDVAAREVSWLTARLGSSGQHLWELSQGIDTRDVVPDRDAKSVGAQDTFDEDLRGEEALRPHIHSQAVRVGRRLRRSQVQGRVVQLTVKYGDFTSITRRRTLETPTDDGQVLYREALELLRRVDLSRTIRLTGVAAQELSSGEQQLGLFAEDAPKKSVKLNETLDRIASKFGSRAIATADLSRPPSSAPEEERDGFYREEKRESAVKADKAQANKGLTVERDEEPIPD